MKTTSNSFDDAHYDVAHGYCSGAAETTGYFAGHYTRYADEPHDYDRPDDQRFSRCEALEEIKENFTTKAQRTPR